MRVRARRRCARTPGTTTGWADLGRRVGNAPVHTLGPGRELRAHLANAVAQGDDRVEPLSDELVEVLGAIGADVDATLRKDTDRIGMERLRMASSARRADRAADIRSSSASAIWDRALFPVHRNSTRGRRRDRPGGAGRAPRTRVRALDAARGRAAECDAAGGEIDRVVAVAPVGRASARRHESSVAEQAQVVRHQVLGLVEQDRQLLDGPVALHQLSHQAPPQRMRGQPQEHGRPVGFGPGCGDQLHS